MLQAGTSTQQWADFGIFAIRFNTRGTHIEFVKLRPDLGDTFGNEQVISREAVVQAIKQRRTFSTIYRNQAGNWDLGARVEIVLIHGQEFIKTVADRTPCDNLDNLPEF